MVELKRLVAATTTSIITSLLFGALVAVEGKTSAPDNVSSRLMIHIPHSLYREEGYDHREALFGMPAYGGSLALPVYYTDDNLCGDTAPDKTEFKPKRNDGDMDPYILMVSRGGCTFVQKVRKAQQSGASAVVVADNVCQCTDTKCTRKNTDMCESQEPIMADDGSGKDISIPSFLMFKVDADEVIDELNNEKPVRLEMAWSLPTPDDRVEYDLWTTPADRVARDFFGEFRPIVDALGKSAFFTPHMYIYNGSKSGCTGGDTPDGTVCGNLCTNEGRYCATDPDNDLESGVSGADVVRESLRRICIWREYGLADGRGTKWWEYVQVFNERCNDPDKPEYFMDVSCINDVMKKVKIDGKNIAKCMESSGGVDDKDKINDFLEWEIGNQTQHGVVVIPTAFVNDAAIRGALTPGNIFTAICSGFSKGTAPKACKCSGCAYPASCIANRYRCPHTHSSADSAEGVSTTFFMFSMLLVVGVFSAAGIWHYKRTKDEMREQVRGILAEYMPLEDNDGLMNGGSKMHGFQMPFSHDGGQTTSLIS